MEPSAAQMPYFMFEAFVEALALGLGVSFLAFGVTVTHAVGRSSSGASRK
jgi:hypothetical protein